MPDLRSQILALAEKREQKALDAFPGAFVRKLSVSEVNSLSNGDKETSSFRLFAMCIVDKEGNPAFKEEDAAELAKLPADKFGAIIREAMTFNGMNADAAETAAKN